MPRPPSTPPDQTHPTAHLLVDMVNPFDWEGADRLYPQAMEAARRIASLKRRLSQAGIPTVYVNDNFGRWDLGFRELVDLYLESESPAARVVEIIAPEAGDFYILKPKHSAFYNTSLEALLARWQTRRVIITGIAANICVLFTAADAHMRDFKIAVPGDCTAAEDEDTHRWALRQMNWVAHADTRASDELLAVNGPSLEFKQRA
jgi:nicotinamidase-related amidase